MEVFIGLDGDEVIIHFKCDTPEQAAAIAKDAVRQIENQSGEPMNRVDINELIVRKSGLH